MTEAANLARLSAAELAVRFHETYERLAPSFRYETRKKSRTFDPDSPNGKLMIAVCGEILNHLKGTGDALPAAPADGSTGA